MGDRKLARLRGAGSSELVQVFRQPRRGFGEVDKAILDDRSLRVHAHRLLVGRLVARDAMAALGDQILDQLGARGFVLDSARRWR